MMNAPYLLIPVALILLILYGISLLFMRLEVLSRSLHRKIWNYGLLTVFVVSACLGILMAVQVNYKLEVPWTEKVLKWHVNFGIAMTAIGIFHLIWHWRYYFPVGPGRNTPGNPGSVRPAAPYPLLFMIGFAGVAFQTYMIRELPGLFQGNELLLSIILFLWLITTGAGAFAGNRVTVPAAGKIMETHRKSSLVVRSLLFLPLLLVPLLFYSKSLFFAPGIEAGPLAFAGFTLFIIWPFCFLNGFAFTYMVRLWEPEGLTMRKAYALESLGGAAAGIACTLAILAGIFSFPGGRIREKLFHPNDQILATRSGPSGRLTITENGDQVNIFENGVLAQSTDNTLVCEEMAHFAMIQHPDPRRILVIGGLLSGIDRELAKYPEVQVDFTEPDRQLFRLAGRLGLIPDQQPPLRYIRKPLSTWINHPDQHYDVILVMLPGPQNLNLNRFYTAGFFSRLRKILGPGGVVSVILPGTANYVSGSAIATLEPVRNALGSVFQETLIFPAENNYLMGRDLPLRTDILNAMNTRNIEALYITTGYFDEQLFTRRIGIMNGLTVTDSAPNTDLRPSAYFGQITWWLGQFPAKIILPIGAILLVLLIFGMVSGNSGYAGMFIMGAGASGMEIMLLFLLQVSAGTLYLMTGLLLASFMGGLAAGSSIRLTGRTGKAFDSATGICTGFILMTVLLMAGALWMTQTGNLIFLKSAYILFVSFGAAFFTGRLFAHLTRNLPERGAGGKLYGYDLVGAAMGALLYPMVLIPLFGILPAAGIIFGSGILILLLTGPLRTGIRRNR